MKNSFFSYADLKQLVIDIVFEINDEVATTITAPEDENIEREMEYRLDTAIEALDDSLVSKGL